MPQMETARLITPGITVRPAVRVHRAMMFTVTAASGIMMSTVAQYCHRLWSFPHLVSVDGYEMIMVMIIHTKKAMDSPTSRQTQHTAATTAAAGSSVFSDGLDCAGVARGSKLSASLGAELVVLEGPETHQVSPETMLSHSDKNRKQTGFKIIYVTCGIFAVLS
jgi:hypothetical protein